MFIYKITNTKNNKIYIGKTKNYIKRFKQHKYRLSKGNYTNKHFVNAWNKYGEE